MGSVLASKVGEFALFVLFPVAVLLLLIAAPLSAILIMRKGPRRLALMTQEASAAAQGSEAPLVHLRFHTYHGLIVSVVQTKHDLVLPYPQARLLLDHLHRFNLTWGFFAYGAAIIPIFSFFNRRSELLRIQRQAEAKGRSFPTIMG